MLYNEIQQRRKFVREATTKESLNRGFLLARGVSASGTIKAPFRRNARGDQRLIIRRTVARFVTAVDFSG